MNKLLRPVVRAAELVVQLVVSGFVARVIVQCYLVEPARVLAVEG